MERCFIELIIEKSEINLIIGLYKFIRYRVLKCTFFFENTVNNYRKLLEKTKFNNQNSPKLGLS